MPEVIIGKQSLSFHRWVNFRLVWFIGLLFVSLRNVRRFSRWCLMCGINQTMSILTHILSSPIEHCPGMITKPFCVRWSRDTLPIKRPSSSNRQSNSERGLRRTTFVSSLVSEPWEKMNTITSQRHIICSPKNSFTKKAIRKSDQWNDRNVSSPTYPMTLLGNKSVDSPHHPCKFSPSSVDIHVQQTSSFNFDDVSLPITRRNSFDDVESEGYDAS